MHRTRPTKFLRVFHGGIVGNIVVEEAQGFSKGTPPRPVVIDYLLAY